MTAPVAAAHLVVARDLTETLPAAARRHPLATQSGAVALVNLLIAGRVWRQLTARQRQAIHDAYQAALDAVEDAPDGTVVPLPELPTNTHPATRRALEKRGLAADGRLTALAVQVVAHVPDEARPVKTIYAAGERL